jgi:Fic family protein
MLEGILQQAEVTISKILKINDLMREVENKLKFLNLDYHKITEILFSNPYISVSNFKKQLGVSKATALRYIKKLEENQIISSVKV